MEGGGYWFHFPKGRVLEAQLNKLGKRSIPALRVSLSAVNSMFIYIKGVKKLACRALSSNLLCSLSVLNWPHMLHAACMHWPWPSVLHAELVWGVHCVQYLCWTVSICWTSDWSGSGPQTGPACWIQYSGLVQPGHCMQHMPWTGPMLCKWHTPWTGAEVYCIWSMGQEPICTHRTAHTGPVLDAHYMVVPVLNQASVLDLAHAAGLWAQSDWWSSKLNKLIPVIYLLVLKEKKVKN